MLKTPLFWLMFAMMAMMSTGGLMVVANFASFAKEFGVADAIVFGFAALPFALTFDRITNGLTRPFFGWVSDHVGRENTMAVAFALEAVAICMLLMFRENAYAFALLSGLVFFAWGEIFSLFPSTLTDTFGTKHATTNYGFLYMAQGVGSLLGGPVAALIHDSVGSWVPVFGIAIGLDLVVAALAWFVLKPPVAPISASRVRPFRRSPPRSPPGRRSDTSAGRLRYGVGPPPRFVISRFDGPDRLQAGRATLSHLPLS